MEELLNIDLNTLVVGGAFIPPLLVFLVQWFKGPFEKQPIIKTILPFIFGFVFSFLYFQGFTWTSILGGFFLGALATGEYRSLIKPLSK